MSSPYCTIASIEWGLVGLDKFLCCHGMCGMQDNVTLLTAFLGDIVSIAWPDPSYPG